MSINKSKSRSSALITSGKIALLLQVIAAVQVVLYLLALLITAGEAKNPISGVYPLGLNGASLAFILLGSVHIAVFVTYLVYIRKHGLVADKKVLFSFSFVVLLAILAPVIFTWVYDSNSYLNDYTG